MYHCVQLFNTIVHYRTRNGVQYSVVYDYCTITYSDRTVSVQILQTIRSYSTVSDHDYHSDRVLHTSRTMIVIDYNTC